MTSKKNILKIAEKVKKYVEENHKIPSTVTVDGVKYTWPQVWYILSWATINLNKDLDKVPNVKACSNATGDTINEKIKPDDYKDQAKRIVKYIKEKGKAPNYVTSKSKKKIRPKVSLYANARIVVWYYNHHILPNYCTYDSNAFKAKTKTKTTTKTTTTKKKHGHSTISGCDNRGQNTSYYCGCHSLQEVFRNLTGKVVKQSTIASVAGTTTSGTDHQGLSTAVAWFNKKYGFNLKVEWKNFSDLGWKGLEKLIKSDNKDFVIHNLYRNQWGHYEVVNSISGSNVKVQNSLGSSCSNGCYCGYVEDRSTSVFRSYISGISQKSIMVITRVD